MASVAPAFDPGNQRTPRRVPQRRVATLRDRVTARVQELMAPRPDGVLLRDLIAELVRETLAPEYTIRSYVAKLPFLVCEAPGPGHTKHCRLTYPAGLEKYLQRITPPGPAQECRQAVALLQVETVHHGLFMLSKQFEASLRSYLRAPATLGADEKKMLKDLVQRAFEQGLIADRGHLEYLRYERNEFAHGDAPPLDERRAQMSDLQLLAGTYLNYIGILRLPSRRCPAGRAREERHLDLRTPLQRRPRTALRIQR